MFPLPLEGTPPPNHAERISACRMSVRPTDMRPRLCDHTGQSIPLTHARRLQVLAQLKRYPGEGSPRAAGLEADLLCRLLKENPALKRLEVSCRPRLAGSIVLKRYGAGEVCRRKQNNTRRRSTTCGSRGVENRELLHTRL